MFDCIFAKIEGFTWERKCIFQSRQFNQLIIIMIQAFTSCTSCLIDRNRPILTVLNFTQSLSSWKYSTASAFVVMNFFRIRKSFKQILNDRRLALIIYMWDTDLCAPLLTWFNINLIMNK